MKKILLLIVSMALLAPSAFGWGRQGHAIIAYIAESHLTPKAKKQIAKYLDGRSMVAYASWADENKNNVLVDLGFDPTNCPRVTTYPHTFEANADGMPYRGIRRNGEYVKNCIYYLEKFIADLKNAEEMNPTERFQALAFVIHFVGDMHCPEHIRYPEDQTIGYYPVKFLGKTVRYHTFWDETLLAFKHPWGFRDAAYLIDYFDERARLAICEGDLTDWAKETALDCRHVHEVKEGAELDKPYAFENIVLCESQIRKAGYRLAAILNYIFV